MGRTGRVTTLGGVAARFGCGGEQRYEGGDHVIIVSQVERYGDSDGVPLVLSRGAHARPAGGIP